VSRWTLYNYIAHGCVEYVRAADGSLRIFVDTLEHAESRLREIRKRQRLERQTKPRAGSPSRQPPPRRRPLRHLRRQLKISLSSWNYRDIKGRAWQSPWLV
jgi:hypothetical protein